MINTKGEIFWIILMAIAGIILAVLALGLATGENRYLGVFTGQYSNKSADKDSCGILIDEPAAKKTFMFPFTVSGKITGCGWSASEGMVGSVHVIDGTGTEVSFESLEATSAWNSETVTFNQNISIPIMNTEDGKIRFKNIDSSGENPLSFDIPVNFQQ
ncbi:MAG: hypothetical protein ACI88L_000107 [Candidatus Paceibacteria bacterium]|jgi:hypothetical protein